MKLQELKQIIREEIQNSLNENAGEINTSQSMPKIQISKSEYDKLKSTGRIIVTRTATGFNHNVSPLTLKRYPKGQYEILVQNPHDKKYEVFFAKVNHDWGGVYLEISNLD
jgi:hypothetical protein